MKKDSEATRRRILAAAVVEFADHGIAGARVDRIATAAESNKQLLYQYFGNKEGLFRTILARELTRATESVTLSPDDLEGYAGAFFDFAMANPRLMRLIAWCGLEAGGSAAISPTGKAKLDLIAAAQKGGHAADRFSPAFILSTISALGTAWVPSNWYGSQLDPDAVANAASHREAIIRLVGMMIRPDPKL